MFQMKKMSTVNFMMQCQYYPLVNNKRPLFLLNFDEIYQQIYIVDAGCLR
jgi:hypothetical protein